MKIQGHDFRVSFWFDNRSPSGQLHRVYLVKGGKNLSFESVLGTKEFVINPDDDSYMDNISSVSEIKSRDAKVIGISNKPDPLYDYWIEIPTIRPDLYPLIEILPLQLISYYLALERGIDPDYPKNLAKSVTVK